MPKKISLYITKGILLNFFVIYVGLFFLSFTIDFVEKVGDFFESKVPIHIALKMVTYRIPLMLQVILYFIFFIAGLLCFYKMSNNSEINVIRTSGFSIFKMLLLPMLVAFCIGVFVIFVYDPMAVDLDNKAEEIKSIYLKNKNNNIITPNNGIWFKENNGKLLIRAESVDISKMQFNNVIFTYLDNNYIFFKRVDSESVLLQNNHWILTNNYIYREGVEREFVKDIGVETNISKQFIIMTLRNTFENTNIPFTELQNAIQEFKKAGFESIKFEVRYYNLLTIPFIFIVMTLFSAYFGIINNRDSKKYLSLLYGICVCFSIFIFNSVIGELASANRLTIFDSSGLLILLYLLVSIILLMKKDILNNYLV